MKGERVRAAAWPARPFRRAAGRGERQFVTLARWTTDENIHHNASKRIDLLLEVCLSGSCSAWRTKGLRHGQESSEEDRDQESSSQEACEEGCREEEKVTRRCRMRAQARGQDLNNPSLRILTGRLEVGQPLTTRRGASFEERRSKPWNAFLFC